jgi:hypothetical protein
MKTLIVILSILILSGCKKDNPASSNDTTLTLETSDVIDSVKFTLSLMKSEWSVGDTLDAALLLTNQSTTTKTFNFGYVQQLRWSVRNDSNHILISYPNLLSPAETQLFLNPLETTTYDISTKLNDKSGVNLSPGNYSLYVSLATQNVAQLNLEFKIK